MAKVYFFGYGSYRDKQKVKEIIGREPEGGQSAILEGYSLAVQELSQIPEKPRQILEKVWGSRYRAYTVRRGTGIVIGRIWKISEEDLVKIKQWEFVETPWNDPKNKWREITNIQAKAIINGRETLVTALTDKAFDTQPIKEVTNGLEYEINLNKGLGIKISTEDEYKIIELRKEIGQYIQGNIV